MCSVVGCMAACSDVVMLYLTDNPTKGAIAEREVRSVSLKKDPKLGLGECPTLFCIKPCLFSFLGVIAMFVCVHRNSDSGGGDGGEV